MCFPFQLDRRCEETESTFRVLSFQLDRRREEMESTFRVLSSRHLLKFGSRLEDNCRIEVQLVLVVLATA